MSKYILAIDQSTQGTKALLFDDKGVLLCRTDKAHKQIINNFGWVEHDLREIYANTLEVVKNLVAKSGIDKSEIYALGISNQRETSACWDKTTGEPLYNAIVWQCSRGAAICEEIAKQGHSQIIHDKTGIQLSPYFPAAKLAWIFQNVEGARENKNVAVGTIDSWLVYKLTGGKCHKTDYSNASRTQLFNIKTLKWDDELLNIFGLDKNCMAEITDSDGDYGETDFDGWLDKKIPICGVLGDSHGALFGQGCLTPGMIKATYGTGSSVMMNIGEKIAMSSKIVTSLAWKINGKINYVLEGNINYTGAVITWLKDDLKLIDNPGETESLARNANKGDKTYLVPAFSGLGAPYWESHASACIVGMTRATGKNEIVRAALDCIAYQITDIIESMRTDSGVPVNELRVDGGPTRNSYLMQFQSDILNLPVRIPDSEELSGIGAAYCAGLSCGLYDDKIFANLKRVSYSPSMSDSDRINLYDGWKNAVKKSL
ncbi:MAG: glycerol kinase GlpK [Synergistaceae bacterium]|nr:glycerol kinase GlpK [Synergistaceae bacterium]